ncbi:hypothetical protein [Halobaculum sp. MBLA0143]|uniref:hypothetical protein n=1 Tax=Halobaculum sp. MBLA0143 TaxID=3079933 RepID=UPI0035237F18
MREILAEALADTDARADGRPDDATAERRGDDPDDHDEFGPPRVAVVAVGAGATAVVRPSASGPDGVETVAVDGNDCSVVASVDGDEGRAATERAAATVADADLVFLVVAPASEQSDATASATDTATGVVETATSVADTAAADTPVVGFCRASASVGSGDPSRVTRARLAAPSSPVDTTVVAPVGAERLGAALARLAATITQPGLVGLDYGRLYTILGAGGVGLSVVATVPDDRRPSPVVADATAPDATAPGPDPDDASGAFVHLAGGPDLTLRTAERVFETATRGLDPDATTAWSADTRPATAPDRLRVTCLYTDATAAPVNATRE